MKIPLQILRLSAGKISDNNMLFASVTVLDDSVAGIIEQDRIDVGQQHAKINISTDNENELARKIANSGLLPCAMLVEVETIVKQGSMQMKIIGFNLEDQKNIVKQKVA